MSTEPVLVEVNARIDRTKNEPAITEVVHTEAEPVNIDAVRERYEAALVKTIKEYITDVYPGLSGDQADSAAALTYHFWDDIRDAIPKFVDTIWDEQNPARSMLTHESARLKEAASA